MAFSITAGRKMEYEGFLKRLLAISASLAKHFVERPSPYPTDLNFWKWQSVEAHVRRQRNRMLTLWAVVATIAIIVAIVVATAGIRPVVLGIHLCAVAMAAALLSVPGWRRWLLSKTWSIPLLFIAIFGALCVGAYWPKALGGLPVGILIVCAWFVGILVGATIMFVRNWRTDRRSAIEDLTMIAIIGSSVFLADRFFGKVYGSLLGMMVGVAYLGIRWISDRRRSQREEVS